MSFKDTPADNIAALRIWHTEHHHASSWGTCPHAPCNVTTPTFRANWDQP